MHVRKQQSRERKPRQSTARVLELLPAEALEKTAQQLGLDKGVRKVLFLAFLKFMLIVLWYGIKKPSLRRMAGKSRNPRYQHLSGLPEISHTTLARALVKYPLKVYQELLSHLKMMYQCVDGRFKKFYKQLKWFDTTTVSVSKKLLSWAAKNGAKNAVRVALRVDDRTEAIEVVVNGSSNTSDNAIFADLIKGSRPGSLYVFDSGFTRLQTLKKIEQDGNFFLTPQADIYTVIMLKSWKLPPRPAKITDWKLLEWGAVLLGVSTRRGQLDVNRAVFMNVMTGEKLTLITNHRGLGPWRMFELYHRRWRIEVTFRWLKSEFNLSYFPACSEQGVWTWIYLNLLAYFLLRYHEAMTEGLTSWREWSCRDALIRLQNTLDYQYREELLSRAIRVS